MPCILTRCRVFILTGCNTAPYKRLQRVLPIYTAHAAKQRTGLYSRFSCDCAHSTTHDTRPTKAAIISPVPRWRAYQRPDALNRYQIPPPRWDAGQVSTAAYYNKVYIRGQTMQTAAGQLLPSADLWQVLHPAEQSSSRGTAGGAEPLAASAASLFGLSPDS